MSDEEHVSYRFASDLRALELVYHRLDYSTNALMVGDYPNAIENIEAAWQSLPNSVKAKFKEPVEQINEAIGRIPTEEQLRADPVFMQTNPGWRDAKRYRQSKAREVVYRIIHDLHDHIIRELDNAGLYVSKARSGLDQFGKSYSDAIKGMKFKGPSEDK